MKTFIFCGQTVSRDTGEVKKGREYTIKTDDTGEVSLLKVNTLRRGGAGISAMEETTGDDGKDVSGFGAGSPSLIIKVDGKFYAVPYDKALARNRAVGTGSGKSSESIMNVADFMAAYKVRVGKPEKGQECQFIDKPLTSYCDEVFNAIVGRIEKHSSSQTREDGIVGNRPLVINLAGVAGFTDDNLEELECFVELEGFENVSFKLVDDAPEDEAA
jgi:hypothetical protein